MTTFTTQDRIDAEVTVEPIPFMGIVEIQDQDDRMEYYQQQLNILQAECQRLRKKLRDLGEND
jgi:hypothetical protein